MADTSKISFTIRRPTPQSRAPSSGPESDAAQFKLPHAPAAPSPLSRSEPPSPRRHAPTKASHHHTNNYEVEEEERDRAYDSSDVESTEADELVTGFDKFGVERLKKDKKPANTPLVIPALRNKDWREVARKRRGATSYVPPSAAAVTGKDGSVGGLGTRDSINSGPVLSGLQVKQRPAPMDDDEKSSVNDSGDEKMDIVKEEVKEEESEDALALRAILAESTGDTSFSANNTFAIPIAPVSETDALKQDVDELPDAATLEDYARVPVAQFGAALLRGMGWTEGTAATRKPGKKGLIEPYLPPARPALLGIGAKEQEVYDDGSKKKKSGGRPEKRYVPIVKQERSESGSGKASPALRERSRSPRRSAPSSRRVSPDRYRERGDKDGSGSGRRGESDRDRDLERRRTEDRDRRRKDDRERDRPREGDRERRRDDDRRRDERRYDDSREKSSRREDRHDRRKDY